MNVSKEEAKQASFGSDLADSGIDSRNGLDGSTSPMGGPPCRPSWTKTAQSVDLIRKPAPVDYSQGMHSE